MRKLATKLLVALGLLTSGGAWAADVEVTYAQPSATLDISVKNADLATELSGYTYSMRYGTPDNGYYLDDDYLCLSINVLARSTGSLKWAGHDNGYGNSDGADATAWAEKYPFKGASYYNAAAAKDTKPNNVTKLTTNRMVTVKVTGCTGASVYAAADVQINAYDVTGSSSETAYNTLEKVKSATVTTTGTPVSISGLDASKTYVIQVCGTTSINSKGYEIALARAQLPTGETQTATTYDNGWVSFTPSFDCAVTTEGAAAYIATKVAGSNVTMTKVEKMKAGNGYFLYAGSSEVKDLTVEIAEGATAPAENLIVGCTAATNVDGAANSIYCLGKLNGAAGLYKVSTSLEVPAGKAYLQAPLALKASVLNLVFSDSSETTAVKGICTQAEKNEAAIGTKHIINGKIVIKTQNGFVNLMGVKVK